METSRQRDKDAMIASNSVVVRTALALRRRAGSHRHDVQNARTMIEALRTTWWQLHSVSWSRTGPMVRPAMSPRCASSTRRHCPEVHAGKWAILGCVDAGPTTPASTPGSLTASPPPSPRPRPPGPRLRTERGRQCSGGRAQRPTSGL